MSFNGLPVDPSWVDAAALNAWIFVLFHTKAVVDLDFVRPHEVNAGVGVLGDYELYVQLDISKFPGTQNIGRAPGIEEHPGTGHGLPSLPWCSRKNSRASGRWWQG